ncbi:extracellular polygalacturonase [Penicillium atrosanguineum]|uniref:endo-polygalacturonase n=1 Tax=Penicillium atrosanguineum TaxID=1132637 RepID=A0A9W9GTS4_9EURO|nr:extracellular polygalacturonase [Penicillium atrosanguineum]KAJ5330262.1 extracellular polygalacturonase [Penicillium atrosanguineum]
MPSYLSHMLCAGLAASLVAAAPAPSRVSELVKKSSSTCTFTEAARASASKSSCSTIVLSDIEVPAGETLDLTDLNDGTKVIFEGTTTFGYEEWDGPLIKISGSGITVEAADGAEIDGDGSRWWDGEGTNGGKTKPKFFYAHSLDDSTITGLSIKNTPVQVFSIESDNLVIDSVTIDNSDGDDNGGHNTDGFDIGESTYITIKDAVVKNQDDCVAINSGENIYFTGGTCSGGHGLSIGSVGGRDDNTVKNVTFTDSTVTDSANGVRIKTVYDATGSVSDITFSNLVLSGITDYGIVIEHDYENGSPTGTPTDGVPITDLTVDGISGSLEDDAVQVYILCGDDSCSDWTWEDVSLTGGDTSDDCENVPSGASC